MFNLINLQHNIKMAKPRLYTPEEMKERLKISRRKYYHKNKEAISEQRKQKVIDRKTIKSKE